MKIKWNVVRLYEGTVLFLLPFLGYFVFAYFASYYAGDSLHTGTQALFSYLASGVNALFPYLCMGLGCSAVARSGFAGNGVLLWGIMLSRLTPYLFEIAKNFCVNPVLRKYPVEYLTATAQYTVLNYLFDSAIYAALLILSFRFYSQKKKKKQNPRFASLLVMSLVLLAIALVLNIMDSVDFVREQLYEYYDEISALEILTMILSYVKIAVIALIGFLLSLVQANLVQRLRSH